MLPIPPLVREERSRLQPTAQRVLELVRLHPGICVGELIQRAELSGGTIHHHLKRLESRGLVTTTVAGRRRLVFAADARVETPDADVAALALLRGRTAQAVASAIVDTPPQSILTLMQEVGDSPRALYYNVKRLKEAGLVSSSSLTRYRGLCPTPKLLALMRRLRTPATDESGP